MIRRSSQEGIVGTPCSISNQATLSPPGLKTGLAVAPVNADRSQRLESIVSKDTFTLLS
jgi:hypothetical protein